MAQKRAAAAQREQEQKTDATLENIATSGNIDELIKQVKEVQLASLLGGNKPTVILTDQTDLGDKMVELGNKVSETIRGLDSSSVDNEQLTAIKSLSRALDVYTKAQSKDASAIQASLAAVESAIRSIDIAPVINLPEPKVTLKETKIDLTPLKDTIREVFVPPSVPEQKLDLSRYKAQDIDNSVTDKQYIGFVNPEGDWYIIENDVPGNKLRYVFGESGYAAAFAQASSYEYNLLNEATDALSA